MRIGISALFRASGGSLTSLAQLLESWAGDGTLDRHEIVLFAGDGTVTGLTGAVRAETLRRIRIRRFASADAGMFRRLVVEQVRLLGELRRERIDVLFCPGNVVPYAARIPTVAVFQNAAPFCDSVTFRSTRGLRWVQFRLLGRLIRMTARRATRVIFISAFFRDLFVTRFGFPGERGAVIHRAALSRAGAAPDRALEERLGIRGRYMLSVSNVNPYKNLVELIEGFARALRSAPAEDLQLVISGLVNFPWYLEKMNEGIRRHGLQERVVLTGELPHPQIEALLAGCESFVFSSTCENCPTALIEAMSFGLAVASSNVGVMPEIGLDSVLYFDPYDPSSIAEQLRALMTDAALRADLSTRALSRVRDLPNVDEVARRTMAVIEAAAVEMGA
jgi:glycosyltransferase involved in cell wall biosynthesis